VESINYTTFRKDLAKTIDRVNDDHCAILNLHAAIFDFLREAFLPWMPI
jgi:hypothetical protein